VSDQEQRTTPDEVSGGHAEQAASVAGGATRADAHPTGPDAMASPSAVPSPAPAVEPDATTTPLPVQREPEPAGPTADAPPPVTPATTALPEPPSGQACPSTPSETGGKPISTFTKPTEKQMLYEHVDTAVIDGESLPWVPFTPFAENVLLKYFKLDPIRGEWIVMMKAPLDMQLPRHHHTGTVMVYTFEGRWKYKEHDWVATPGSIVYETAASTHTPEVVSAEGEGGYAVMLVQVSGDLLFFDENDNIIALENWKTGLQRYLAYCAQHGIAPKDLTAFN